MTVLIIPVCCTCGSRDCVCVCVRACVRACAQSRTITVLGDGQPLRTLHMNRDVLPSLKLVCLYCSLQLKIPCPISD